MNVLEAILAAQNGGALPQLGRQGMVPALEAICWACWRMLDADHDGSVMNDVAGKLGRFLGGR